MFVHMAQETIALAGHDRREALPTFEGQDALVDRLAAFRTVPGVEKGGGIVLDAAADEQFRRGRAVAFNGAARAAPHRGRRGSPR